MILYIFFFLLQNQFFTYLAYLTVFLFKISSIGPINLRKLAESKYTTDTSDYIK